MGGNKQSARNPEWGKWLRRVRKSAGLTMREVSRRAGIDPSYVTMMERGGYVPSRNVLEKIAKSVGCSVDEAMLRAGFCPESLTPEMYERLLDPTLVELLARDLRQVLTEHVMPLKPSSRERKQLLTFLSGCVMGFKARRRS